MIDKQLTQNAFAVFGNETRINEKIQIRSLDLSVPLFTSDQPKSAMAASPCVSRHSTVTFTVCQTFRLSLVMPRASIEGKVPYPKTM